MAKTHIGILELDRETSLPNLRSAKGGFGFEGTAPKYWNGTSWNSFSGSGGITTWDELYSSDKTLSIDEGTLTFTLSHATNNGLSLTAGVVSGNVVDIQNAGSGYDIQGTDDTWSVSAAGAIVATGLTMADDEPITLGDDSDAVIQWVGTSDYIDIEGAANFDGNITIEAAHSLTIAGAGGATKLTITAGDAVMSDGSLSLTDADNAESVTVINNTATTIGASASAGVVQLESTSLTTGALLNLQLTEGTLAGGSYVRAWDVTGGTEVFSVGENGLATIAGSAAGTDALVITLGDILLGDSDSNVIESEDGVLDLLLLDNKLGAVGSGKAVLKVDAGGVVDAAGFGIYATFTGSAAAGATVIGVVPDVGSYGIKVDAGGVNTNNAIYVDADPTATSAVLFHSQGALAADKATLEVVSDVASCNADSSVARIEQTATDGVAFCMTLKQDDVSEPFINFECASATGNSVDTHNGTEGTLTGFIRIGVNGTDGYLSYYTTPTA